MFSKTIFMLRLWTPYYNFYCGFSIYVKKEKNISFKFLVKMCREELRTPVWCRVALRASDTHTTYTQPPLGAQKIKSSFWLFAKESLHQRDSQSSSVESNAWYKTLIPLRQFNCQNVHNNNNNNMISFISWYKMSSSNNNSTRVKPRRSASFLSKLRPAGQLKTSG